MELELSPQEFEFARLFAQSDAGAASARDAGYSARSAHVIACRLLKRAEIRQEINRLRREWMQNAGLNTDTMLRQLIEIATQQPSIAEYITQDEHGAVWKDPSELTPVQLSCLKATVPVKDVLGQWYRYELEDRSEALSALLSMARPDLMTEQRQIVAEALCALGSQRLGSDVADILRVALRGSQEACA